MNPSYLFNSVKKKEPRQSFLTPEQNKKRRSAEAIKDRIALKRQLKEVWE